MELNILCVWAIPPNKFEFFREILISTWGSVPCLRLNFAHFYEDNWPKISKEFSIHGLLILSNPGETHVEDALNALSSPICLIDWSISASSQVFSDSKNQSAQKSPPYPPREWDYNSPPGVRYSTTTSSPPGETESTKVYELFPPFSLRDCLTIFRTYAFSDQKTPKSPHDPQPFLYRSEERGITTSKGYFIALTEKESALLNLLVTHAPKKLSKSVILETVWGHVPENNLNTHTLETYIYRLRQKFEENGIGVVISCDHEGYALHDSSCALLKPENESLESSVRGII
jgi:DNA-binding winged helix-turn-helix (wHTH) protein